MMKESIVWRGGRVENVYDSICIPGIIATNKGTLLAYAEARDYKNLLGHWGDWAAIDLIMKRSIDGGETWSETRVLCNGTDPAGPGGLRTANNPVMIADGDIIHMLYCTWYALEKSSRSEKINGGVFYIKSEDDGLTWSAPRDISANCHTGEFSRSLLATGPGHGIKLSEKSVNPGMLLVPVWMTPATGGDDMSHHPAVVSTLYSLDHGDTWQLGEVIFESETLRDPNETVAVELSCGGVMLNIRNESKNNRRAVAFSANGYDNWSEPHFDQTLIDPICFGSIIRYNKNDENIILFINCANERTGDMMASRVNLTVRASRDDGATWEASRVLIPGKSGYSDIAVGLDGTIYALYDVDHGDASMNLLRFDLDWIYGAE